MNTGRAVSGLHFSPDGKLLASVSANCDGVSHLWDTRTGEQIGRVGDWSSTVPICYFRPDGKSVCVMSQYTLHTWDISTRKETSQVYLMDGKETVGGITQCTFSPDGQRVLTVASGGRGRISEARTGKLLQSRQIASDFVRPLPDGHTVVSLGTGYYDTTPNGASGTYPLECVWLWDMASEEEGRIVWQKPPASVDDPLCLDGLGVFGVSQSHHAWVGKPTGCLAVSSSRRYLAWHATGSQVHICNLKTGQELGPLPRGDGDNSYAFSPDDRIIAAGNEDGTVRLWELASSRIRQQFKSEGAVQCLAFSPGGRRLASGSSDGNIRVWNLSGKTAEQLAESNVSGGALEDRLWADLGSANPAIAFTAMRDLLGCPATSVPWLQERLRTAIRRDTLAEIDRLMVQLDDRSFQARQKAAAGLKHWGLLARPAFTRTLASHPPLEVRCRVERILQETQDEKPFERLDFLRGLRALEVLEQARTPVARQAIKEFTRHPVFGPEATACWERIAGYSMD